MAEASAGAQPGGPGTAGEAPTEEEIRAAYEEQIKRIRVEEILLENVVTLLNLGMRRTGLSPGSEDERDPAQVRLAIESVRAVLPLLEQAAPEHQRQIRDALSQLQMAFVRIEGTADTPAAAEGGATGGEQSATEGAGPEAGAPSTSTPGEPGPAQRSGRLWVPGQ